MTFFFLWFEARGRGNAAFLILLFFGFYSGWAQNAFKQVFAAILPIKMEQLISHSIEKAANRIMRN